MYGIAQRRAFITQHILPNASGREREIHSHPYEVEITLLGEKLDKNGYLVDLDEINSAMDDLIEYFQDKRSIKTDDLAEIRVRLWENENAYASYEKKV